MKESCCVFGDDPQLAGIITEPSAPARGAVVLVSAGLIPKAGPFRLYAELARRLSLAGFMTLRFDLSGIGDSPRNSGGVPLKKRTELEIRAALDYLTKHHRPADIILGGLCSGAEDSFRFAELDPRVTGVFMIDPFAYRTSGWLWRHLLDRAGRRCRRALGLHRAFPRRKTASPVGPSKPLVSYAYMPRQESTRILEALVNRGVRVHFVYTGGASGAFNHEAQLQSMFEGIDFGAAVTLDHFPRLDHTQVLAEHRQSLVEAITRRLSTSA